MGFEELGELFLNPTRVRPHTVHTVRRVTDDKKRITVLSEEVYQMRAGDESPASIEKQAREQGVPETVIREWLKQSTPVRRAILVKRACSAGKAPPTPPAEVIVVNDAATRLCRKSPALSYPRETLKLKRNRPPQKFTQRAGDPLAFCSRGKTGKKDPEVAPENKVRCTELSCADLEFIGVNFAVDMGLGETDAPT